FALWYPVRGNRAIRRCPRWQSLRTADSSVPQGFVAYIGQECEYDGETGRVGQQSRLLTRVMQKPRSTTYWGIIAGGTGLVVLCAATMPAQAGDQRRAGRDWWSLQPLRPVAVPSVDDSQQPQNPIDHFILHRLKKEGLAPSPTADRRTLIRRLSF